ncbi:CLUMA_CG021350, isoform A [Clunio marinus]|uniref:CLUMA_CG021350, isoform A n=1 Tax=Clunio marinus TaxID=568069 RepID=A0A1J1J7T9_9DIPT|nr:CLUMA_CG021350, isoform A [Clunio marinus]
MLSTEDEWTTEEEIQLFLALHGLRPVGINKHFFMVCIVDRLSKTLNRKISSDQIWKHLKTMYNLKALDDLEPLPFPNEETNFNLPPELQNKLKRAESEDGEGSSKDSDSRRATPKPVALKNSQTNIERKSLKSESNEGRIQPKRTRGSLSAESGSPASTPPPTTKRRRI